MATKEGLTGRAVSGVFLTIAALGALLWYLMRHKKEEPPIPFVEYNAGKTEAAETWKIFWQHIQSRSMK